MYPVEYALPAFLLGGGIILFSSGNRFFKFGYGRLPFGYDQFHPSLYLAVLKAVCRGYGFGADPVLGGYILQALEPLYHVDAGIVLWHSHLNCFGLLL